MPNAPEYDVDFYSDEFILDPYPHYARMRELGPVIYLPRHGNYAVVQHRELREALRNHRVFRSGEGVAADDAGCAFLRGNTLASDPPVHDEMRALMGAPLLPGALERYRQLIEGKCAELVARLRETPDFDGMCDVARFLPETVVTELVGLPDDGRERMTEWAAGSFDILGIQNERGRQGVETVKEMRAWIATHTSPDQLKPGSWTARIAAMSQRGEIDTAIAPQLIRDYINPSLDTTISATGELLLQLANSSGQWAKIRSDPSLVPAAVEEAVRLATPIRSFSRHVAEEYRLGDTVLPRGARLMLVFASANRDPLHFTNPDMFDVLRKEKDHVGFGHGIHMCIGMHLARLEMSSLLRAFIPHFRSFEADPPGIALNNSIRIYAALPMHAEVEPEPERFHTPARNAATSMDWIDVEVMACEPLAETIVGIELAAVDGTLPASSAGAHVNLEILPEIARPYSLCGMPGQEDRYRIAVHLDPASRGGSRAVHGHVSKGTRFRIQPPRNNFPLDETAGRNVLIAGGIGITPILAMAYRLHAIGRDFRLVYLARSSGRAAFLDELAAAPFASAVRVRFSETEGHETDFSELALCPHDVAVYCCGPQSLLDSVRHRCSELGYAPEQVNVEIFGPATSSDDAPFRVVASRSGIAVDVAPNETILDALAAAGLDIPSSCLSGVCGACLTDVVAGVPDHRDGIQTVAEKESNRRIAVCCSRSLSPRLVLDL